MTLTEAMAELKARGDEKMRKIAVKQGAGEDCYGVKLGDVRNLAKKIKADPELAKELWETGNTDARFLAILILEPKELSAEEIDQMVRSVDFGHLADWLTSYVVKQHPQAEELRQTWMADPHPSAGRAGWSLTSDKVGKDPEGLDLAGLLDRIEREMKDAPELSRWTMNYALANIGIHHPALRARAIAIGENLGVYRDYPTPKGCTSPFAPVWIAYMVERGTG